MTGCLNSSQFPLANQVGYIHRSVIKAHWMCPIDHALWPIEGSRARPCAT